MTREEILKIVLNQVEQINNTFPEDQKIVVNETTILFGNGSSIDSLSLVSIIVDLEMIFSSDYNKEISITDDRAMTREISPFDSVASLVDYIFEIINEN